MQSSDVPAGAGLGEAEIGVMTRQEREAIQKLPRIYMNLTAWEKDAWHGIRARNAGCMEYEDARHSALVLDSTWYQVLMLELVRDAAKLRLLA